MKFNPSLRKIGLLIVLALVLFTCCNLSYAAGTIDGYFKPSGVYDTGYSYTRYYREYVDYCPLCSHSNTLANNPKGTIEGEITCTFCDADYSGVTGWDKTHRPRARLTRYYEPEPSPVHVVESKTYKEIILEKWRGHSKHFMYS
jgi:hypothetical protein